LRITRIAQLPPNIDLPRDVGIDEEVRQRIREGAARTGQLPFGSAQRREFARLFETGSSSEAEEWQIRPAGTENFVVRNLNVFGQNPQLLISHERLINQSDQVRIIEELAWPEHRRVLDRDRAVVIVRHGRGAFAFAQPGDMTAGKGPEREGGQQRQRGQAERLCKDRSYRELHP
jgi:hypothetical protein